MKRENSILCEFIDEFSYILISLNAISLILLFSPHSVVMSSALSQ